MMSPRVSIIMPAYRSSATIGESIRSVLSQTASDWELIVVDDCSDDNTANIVMDFVQQDSRIRLIRLSQNSGVANARNAGASQASADWLAFLDGDDLWLPEKLEKQFALIEATNASLAYTGAACIDRDSKKTERIFSVPESVSYRSLLYRTDLICSTVLLRKELFLRHPMERSDLHEDYVCWLGVLSEGIVAHGLNEPLILYRLSPTSKSGNKVRSAVMMWRTYRHLGFGRLKTLWHFLGYAMHGILRYWL